MIFYLGNVARPFQSASEWLLKEYASMPKRIDLIERYNVVAGPQSAAVARVQDEFINGRMERQELVAFVGVCETLIAASNKNTASYRVR